MLLRVIFILTGLLWSNLSFGQSKDTFNCAADLARLTRTADLTVQQWFAVGSQQKPLFIDTNSLISQQVDLNLARNFHKLKDAIGAESSALKSYREELEKSITGLAPKQTKEVIQSLTLKYFAVLQAARKNENLMLHILEAAYADFSRVYLAFKDLMKTQNTVAACKDKALQTHTALYFANVKAYLNAIILMQTQIRELSEKRLLTFNMIRTVTERKAKHGYIKENVDILQSLKAQLDAVLKTDALFGQFMNWWYKTGEYNTDEDLVYYQYSSGLAKYSARKAALLQYRQVVNKEVESSAQNLAKEQFLKEIDKRLNRLNRYEQELRTRGLQGQFERQKARVEQLLTVALHFPPKCFKLLEQYQKTAANVSALSGFRKVEILFKEIVAACKTAGGSND